ncbi:hypothetical protein ACT4US_21725, partial [Bacillus sp. HC-Mk]
MSLISYQTLRKQAKINTLSRLIEAQKEKVRALRQAYDQNKATLGENDAATQRYASQEEPLSGVGFKIERE